MDKKGENAAEIIARLTIAAERIKLKEMDNETSLIYKVMEAFSNVGVNSPMKYILAIPEDPNRIYDTPQSILEHSTWTTLDLYIRLIFEEETKDMPVSLRYVLEQTGMPLDDVLPIYYKYAKEIGGKSPQSIADETNEITEKKETTPYDLDRLLDVYESRKSSTFLEDISKYENIKKLQTELLREKASETTPIVFDSAKIRADIDLNIGGRDESYGLELFDLSRVSPEMRYIQYNDQGDMIFNPNNPSPFEISQKKIEPSRIYYKIYTGVFDPTYYNGKYNRNTIYMKGVDDISAELRLDKMIILYDSTFEAKEKSKRLIEKHIPITIKEGYEVKVSGSFYVFNTYLEYSTFPFMLTIDPVAQNYLYIEERETVLSDRSKINVHYKSLIGTNNEDEGFQYIKASVSVNFDQLQADENTVINGRKIPPGTYYIKVNISKAKSRSVAEQFKQVFSLLISRYNTLHPLYERYYKTFIADWEPESLIKERFGKIARETRSNIDILKSTLPDVFVSGYAKICQADKQPVIANPGDIDYWRHKGRILMEYPPNKDNKILLVCPSDEEPYPHLRKNPLKNKNDYPLIPCCQKTEPKEKGTKSGKGKSEKGVSSYTVTSQRVLDDKTKGTIPESIKNILETYKEGSNFLRVGLPNSPNSLLHCILYADNNEQYMKSSDKEKYVTTIRTRIASITNPSLLKQELYDMDDAMISKNLADNAVFLDPLLYYRAVEEALGCNIFVISFGSDTKKGSFGDLLIPRCELFHIHSYIPERKNVIILLQRPSTRTSIVNPRCELVYDDGNDIRLFDRDVGDIMNKMMNFVNYNVTWMQDRHYINLYANKDRVKSATKQIIDKYGKARGFFVDGVWIFLDPMYPLNIPRVDPSTLKNADFVDAEAFVKIYGEPIAVDRRFDYIVGLSYKNNTYIPIIPVDSKLKYTSLPQSNFNPLITYGKNVVEQLSKVRRDANIILSVVKYIRYKEREEKKIPLSEFVKRLEVLTPHKYDLSRVPRHYPKNWIEYSTPSMVPTLVTPTGKIIMDSEILRKKIMYQLQRFDLETQGLKLNPIVIRGYYATESDFRYENDAVVLIGEAKKNIWLREQTEVFNNVIYTEMDENFSKNTLPYLYTENNKYYIIQNVFGGDLGRVIQVIRYWKLDGYNSGYMTTLPLSISGIPYSIYQISPIKHLDRVVTSTDPGAYPVLRYRNEQYAAILELF